MAWSVCGSLCPVCGHCDSSAVPWDDRHVVLTCERCNHQRLEQSVGDRQPADQTRSSNMAMP